MGNAESVVRSKLEADSRRAVTCCTTTIRSDVLGCAVHFLALVTGAFG